MQHSVLGAELQKAAVGQEQVCSSPSIRVRSWDITQAYWITFSCSIEMLRYVA